MSQSRNTTRIRISLASEAGARRSPFGIIGAVVIHASVVVATLFSWEHRLDIQQESPPIVPVDLVTIAAKTNVAPAAPEIAPAQMQPQQLDLRPPAVKDLSEAAPQSERAPSESAVKAPPPVVPREKPQTKPENKKSKFDIENVFALLNKIAPAKRQLNGKVAANPHKGIGAQTAMTMDLVDALRNQIEQCWSPPAGAPHPEQLVVYVDLALNPDGSVARPPQLAAQSAAAVADNPFMRAAADAALRAIYVCAPFKLPADRYADWRDSTIKFDPRDLAGQ